MAMTSFRDGSATLLLATPGVERGLDMPDVAAVYCTTPPASATSYLHRAGRAGRVGSTVPGGARVTTLVARDQARRARTRYRLHAPLCRLMARVRGGALAGRSWSRCVRWWRRSGDGSPSRRNRRWLPVRPLARPFPRERAARSHSGCAARSAGRRCRRRRGRRGRLGSSAACGFGGRAARSGRPAGAVW